MHRKYRFTLLILIGLGLAAPPSIATATASRPAGPSAPLPGTQIASAAAGQDSTVSSSDSTLAAVPGPELFLAWHAPFGTPRAKPNATLRGGEGAQPETLYLSFDSRQDVETLYGMSAMLVFRAPAGDTLGSLWHFGGGTMNRRNVQIEFPTDNSWGAPRPFRAAGFGASNYTQVTDQGQLQIIYAVQVEQAAPIRGGQRYCFARAILPAGSTLDEGDGQAICVEWVKGEIGIKLEGTGDVARGWTGERFVSVNSPGCKVCAPFRRAPEAWAPGADKPR